MRWLKRFFRRGSQQPANTALWLYVQCSRCGEAIRIRADRRYDLASEMLDPGEEGPAYTMRKEIIGDRCFQRLTVTLGFDRRLHIISRDIQGGAWLSAEEYQVATTQQG